MISLHIDFGKHETRFGIHDDDHWVIVPITKKEIKKDINLISFLTLLSVKIENARLSVEDLIRQKEVK